jgi:hypothetical protein
MAGLLLAGTPAACGGSSSSRGGAPTPESADPPAAAPPGWSRVVNGTAGFSMSLPPGWTARGSGNGSTLVRSHDGALAVAVSADRSNDGTRDTPTTYLRRTLHSLSGYRNLRAGRSAGARGLRYPAAQVEATGTFARTRVRQAITLYALHRPGRVTYTVSVFRSAATRAARYAPFVGGVLRSFRARPPRV